MSYATEGVPMDVRSVLKRARETLQLGRSFAGDSYEEFQNWYGHADMVEQQITAALDALPAEAALPSGMAMMMELSPPRAVAMLERLKADAVMSKFATLRECQAYRQAVEDMLTMVRSDPSPLARPQEEKP